MSSLNGDWQQLAGSSCACLGILVGKEENYRFRWFQMCHLINSCPYLEVLPPCWIEKYLGESVSVVNSYGFYFNFLHYPLSNAVK